MRRLLESFVGLMRHQVVLYHRYSMNLLHQKNQVELFDGRGLL